MEEGLSYAPLLLVIFLAFAVPMLLTRFKRLRLPIVVGELIAGIIVGRSGFGWIEHHDPVLDLLAEFGFVFLMFLSGIEIDFSGLGTFSNRQGTSGGMKFGPLQIGLISFAFTLILSIGFGFVFTSSGLVENPWMMALILSTTSLGVVLPVLKEKGLSSGRFGQSLLISALIADFVTMLLITVFVTTVSKGLTLDILLVGVLFVAFFFMYRFGLFFFNKLPIVRRTIEELSHATAQIKVRAAFTIMLAFVALSENIGTEVILGAFLAGAIVSLLKTSDDAELEHQLNSIGFGFFIPIFFIMVGVDFNLSALLKSPSALWLAPLLIIAALLVKIIPSFIYKVNFSWRETFGAGALLSARLSLIIAASAIGLRLGIISESVNAAIVLVAVITVSFAPTIFSRIVPGEKRTEKRPIIVVGSGEFGIQLAENLRNHHEDVVVVAENRKQQERAAERGFTVVLANAEKPDENLVQYYENTRTLVCVFSDVEKCFRVCYQARIQYGIDHVVARVDAPGEISRFEDIGVTTMSPTLDQVSLLAMLARNPSMYSILTRTDDDKDVCEIPIRQAQHFGKRIRDLNLPGDLVIVALERDGKFIIPTGSTELEPGDKLSLLGNQSCLEKASHIFRSG